jgi:hypothetical protein
LTNVTTDSATATVKQIDQTGGSLSATGADGTVYTLALPAGALPGAVQVGLYPVMSLAAVPAGSRLVAGVQYTPEGLTLLAPGTLTIAPRASLGTTIGGVDWRGNGVGAHAAPIALSDGRITMTVHHFSGQGLEDPPLVPLAPSACRSDDDLDAALAWASTPPITAASWQLALSRCWSGFVGPELATQTAAAGGADAMSWASGFVAYSVWLAGLGQARAALHDPSFVVAPAYAQSRTAGVAFLRAWYLAWNADCRSAAGLDWHVPVKFARLALLYARQPAVSWGLATRANQLDVQTLLDQLCVRVVIDPARSYAAQLPGETGSISVRAGFSINGGPMQVAAGAVSVRAVLTGSTTVIGEGPTDANGAFAADLAWPDGLDPIRIDLLATLIDTENFDDAGTIVINLPTAIERFDRITKPALRLSFTFDRDFDSWSHGISGPEGGANWGLADHLSVGGGVVHLDGRGSPSTLNAWIFRSFDLPANTTNLTLDASAEIIAGSSSIIEVRVVAGGTTTTILRKTLRNSTNHLSFAGLAANLAPWAGQHVTIYIGQNDNTPAGQQGFDKEIYVDNVEIHRS